MKHPYPEHVVEAVAEAMGRSRTGEDWGRFQDYFIEHTHVALQALWDASRVDDIQQIDGLMPNALLRTTDGYMWAGAVANKQDVDLLPARVLHWGDAR